MLSLLKAWYAWLTGAIIALVAVYILGRRDGKAIVKNKTNEGLADAAKKSNAIDSLSYDELVVMLNDKNK